MGPRIIVALDYPDKASALALARQLKPELCRLKVGMELFTACGPDIVAELQALDFDVFLDLKFHDIPNTVAHTCRVAADLGVWMLNVHTLGGTKMLEAAKEGIVAASKEPYLIGVTILTSHSDEDVRNMGYGENAADAVDRLVDVSVASGLDGVVCSAHEASRLRSRVGQDFLLVTPGIRPGGSDAGDQSRIMTPVEAISAGASYLVIGRPITGANDPVAALSGMNADLRAIKP